MRRTLIFIVVILLLLAAAFRLFASGALAERVRVRVVEEAARALGRHVTIARVGGDPWRGIELHGVRIASGPTPQTAPFLAASRLTVRFRLHQLVADLFARRGIIASISALELERPFLALQRDDQGRWNYADLIARTPLGAAEAFRARIETREGEVVFTDAAGLEDPFVAHFERVSGSVDLASAPRLRIALDAVNTDGNTPALLRAAGTAVVGESALDLDIVTRGASVSHWAPYLVRLPWLTWSGGTVDGTLHLLATPWQGRVVLDYRGQLTVRDGRALVPSRSLRLVDVGGPLVLTNRSVVSEGLSMRLTVDGSAPSAVWVRGEVTYLSGVYLDLVMRAPALDLAALQRLLFPGVGLQLQGRASGDMRILGRVASPRVDGTINRASGEVASQRFDDLSAQFQYYGGVLVVDDVDAKLAGGRVQGHVRLDAQNRRFFALASARDVQLSRLRTAAIGYAEDLGGTFSGIVAAAGDTRGVVAEGYVHVAAGSVRGIPVDEFQAAVGLERGQVAVEHLTVRAGGSHLHGWGQIGAAGEMEMNVAASRLDLARVAGWFNLRPVLNGTANALGHLRGTLDAPVLTADVRVLSGQLGPFPFDEVRGALTLTPNGVQTSRLSVRDGPARYQASGAVRWDADRLDLTVRAEQVSASRLLEMAKVPVAVSGTVRGQVRLSGSLQDPDAAGEIELVQGAVQGQRIDRAEAEFRWTGSELLIDRARFEANASRIDLGGRVGRDGRLGLSFAGQGIQLRDVTVLQTDVLAVGGAADLSGAITGRLAAPVVMGTVASTSLVINGEPFDQAEGQVRYQRSRLTLSPLVLQQGAGRLAADGSILLRRDPVLGLRFTVEQIKLSTLLELSRTRTPLALGGTIDGVMTLFGLLSNPQADISARLVNGRAGTHTIRDAALEASLADHGVTLRSFTITPAQGELVGAGRIDLQGESDVEFSGRGLDLDLFRPLLRVNRPLSGTVDFTLQAGGKTTDPLVGLSADVQDGGIGLATFDRFTLQAFYREGQFHIEQGLLVEGPHKAKVEGTVPFNPARLRFDEARPMNLRLAFGEADLSLLTLLTDEVERASGSITGEVLFTGTVAQPKMAGMLALSNGTLKLKGVSPEFTALRVDVALSEDQVRLQDLQARSGDGTLKGSGTLAFTRFRPTRLSLTLAADGARLGYAPLFEGTVNGTMRVDGPLSRLTIAGALTLSDGQVTAPLGERPVAQSTPRRFDPIVDVEFSAGEALWVNVGGLRLQVQGTVRTTGTFVQPRLSGEVSSERGSFRAFNTTFSLVEGRATFAEFRGTAPFVDALAQTRVGTTEIFVHVQGTPEHLNMDLSSDPPLGQHEILALLGGQAGVSRLIRGDLEGAVRAEMSSLLFGRVGRAVAQAFQLEEFTIEYDFARPLQLRIGKLLISNFYVSLTSEFDIPIRHIWSLEYRFTPNTMLSFSIDNRGRTDVLYRVTYRF